jgi:hypothetical protein
MARKENTGIRKPMSEETRKKIAQAVKQKAKVKRIEAGLPPDAVIPMIPDRGRDLELVQMKDQHFDPALVIPMPLVQLSTNSSPSKAVYRKLPTTWWWEIQGLVNQL